MIASLRVVPMRYEGVVYTPIVNHRGRVLDLPQLTWLAAAGVRGPARHIDFVLADESQPRTDLPALRLAHVHLCEDLPLELADTGLAVGQIDYVEGRPAGATPHTVGPHLVAQARVHPTALGDIVWRGVAGGALRGTCAVLVDGEGGHPEIVSVRLGALEESCLPSCSVRAWWEEGRPADPSCDFTVLPARTLPPRVSPRHGGRAVSVPVAMPGGAAAGVTPLSP